MIKAVELIPFVSDLLKEKPVIITNKGNSMRPFIRDQIDRVEIHKLCEGTEILREIVLCERYPDDFAMHRVIKVEDDQFYIVGDAQYTVEGPIKKEKIVGIVKAIYRKNKRISSKSIFYKILVYVWMFLRPYRVQILKIFYPIK